MKALVATLSIKKEAWDRVKSSILRRPDHSQGITVELADVAEPPLVSPQWVKVRSIMSGISDMDEGMILYQDASALSPILRFPFVPGNENVGIVTEAGREVKGVELGQRVIVDPLLACAQRQMEALCPMCAQGEPHCCRNIDKGVVGPGLMIGACSDTGGGWGDSFIAHHSQVYRLPDSMQTESAIIIPELARALKAVLRNPPSPGDRVIIMGAGSLGLLTVLVLQMLGYDVNLLMIAEHPFELDMARRITGEKVTLADAAGAALEEVAEFVGGSVRYPRSGRLSLEGGADIVYDTTGRQDLMRDALSFAGEGKRFVMTAMKQTRSLDLASVWHKGVKILGPGWSKREFFEGATNDIFNIALALIQRNSLPVSDLLSHRFTLDQHHEAFSALEHRSTSHAVKVILKHVV